MNYLIVLLLLFGTDFTCSVTDNDIVPANTNMVPDDIEMVPFDTEYTDAVKNFITAVVSGYYDKFSFLALFIANVEDKIRNSSRDDECDKEPNPLVPGTFRPTKSGKANCRFWCARTNFKYVSFLQDATSKAIEEIFLNNNSRYTIELFYPIHETQSKCVYYERRKIFICNCITLRYRIMVSKFLKNDLERAVELHEHSTYRPKYDIKIEFFAFVLLLKYHPQAAPLYLSYLTHKYALPVYPSITDLNFESYSNSNTEVSTNDSNEGSLTDSKGPILRNETEIFERIIKSVYVGFGNVRVFGSLFFNPVLPIKFIILLLLGFFLYIFYPKLE